MRPQTVPKPRAALTALGVTKSYGRTLALAGVSFSVPAGSITALIGPNGAGKSTLLRAWAGLDKPTSGHVSVCGIDPWVDRERAVLRLGFIPQSAAIYADLSVADHLDLAAHFRPAFDRKVAERHLADLSILPRLRGGTLSGGQQAQVALALALGSRAEVLLLDEPLASLDPLARREFLHVLRREVLRNGQTVLLSSHVVSDVEQVCDRLAILGGGQLLLDGALADAMTRHTVYDGASIEGERIGAFVGIDAGRTITLSRTQAEQRPSGGRTPTVEDLVLGYLAAGRALQIPEPPETK